MKLDVLAFGAHPDDVELSCGGMLLIEKQNGKKTGVIDLTAGELGSRGTVETRFQEAAKAKDILELDIRENLHLEDGFFRNDKESVMKIIAAIRRFKPEVVVCNAPDDRHPDHGRAAQLISDACFLSGLIKIETSENDSLQKPWRPKLVLHYIQDRYLEPDFLLDITSVIDGKINAIKAYTTQFYNPNIEGPETYISKPEFLENLVNRNKILGKRIGVPYAEGFITKKIIGIRNLDAIIQETT